MKLTKIVTGTGLVSLVLAGGAAFEARPANASPIVARYAATSDVGHRTGPVAAPDGSYGIPSGGVMDVECQTLGQPAGPHGNTLYLKGFYGGREMYLPDAYSNSPHLAGQPPIPGIPMCDANQGPSARVQTGASETYKRSLPAFWALRHVGQNTYHNMCLAFAFASYEQTLGTNLRSQVNIPIGYNSYPDDLINHITQGQIGTGVAPLGALVFYSSYAGRTMSHITVSTGRGDTVSTSDRISPIIHKETQAQHSYAKSSFWWLPAIR